MYICSLCRRGKLSSIDAARRLGVKYSAAFWLMISLTEIYHIYPHSLLYSLYLTGKYYLKLRNLNLKNFIVVNTGYIGDRW